MGGPPPAEAGASRMEFVDLCDLEAVLPLAAVLWEV